MQTYTLTALPRNSMFSDPKQQDEENNLDQDLNRSNVSSWVLNNLPRTPRLPNRKLCTARTDAQDKRAQFKFKAKGFKLPLNNATPYPQHVLQQQHQADLLSNYERIQLVHPTSPSGKQQVTGKVRNSPVSRIPNKQGPKPFYKPSYTQVASRNAEKHGSNYVKNIPHASSSKHSEENLQLLHGKSSFGTLLHGSTFFRSHMPSCQCQRLKLEPDAPHV